MNPATKIQETMSIILYIGILVATLLVLSGGTFYLLQHGGENVHIELISSNMYQTSLMKIWGAALSFSPLGIVEFGLMILVITQVLRVALLACFYVATRDYWFVVFSLLILFILIYSLVWQK